MEAADCIKTQRMKWLFTERSFHAGAALFYLMNAADRTIILLRVIISTQVFVIMTAKGGMTHGKDPVSGR